MFNKNLLINQNLLLQYRYRIKFLVNKHIIMNILKVENKILELFFSNLVLRQIKTDYKLFGYRYFINSFEIKEWGSNHSKYFQKMICNRNNLLLSSDESFELDAINFYCGYTGRQINDVLRGMASFSGKEDLNDFIGQLDKTLNNFKTHENVIAIRRMPCEFLPNGLRKGGRIIEKGFLSTSLNLFYRADYDGDNSLLHNEALVLIEIPKGTNAAYIEEAIHIERQREEFELLLQRNLTFIVKKNIKIFSNRIVILKVIV
jgi:hypothetical protein